MAANIDDVAKAIGVSDYQIPTITVYFDDVCGFLREAGVKDEYITSGLVARGVLDLWDYGSGTGRLSDYFKQRATQLSYK